MLTLRRVETPLGPLDYTLERKRVKNLNLRVRSDGTLYVSAGSRVPLHVIDDFVRGRAEWVHRVRARMTQRQENALPPHEYRPGELFFVHGTPRALALSQGKAAAELTGDTLALTLPQPEGGAQVRVLLDRFFREESRKAFSEILEEQYPPFGALGAPRPALRVRTMTSRWGSCHTGKAIITLNTRLVCAPGDCAAYVAVHELCHLLVPDHSARFYGLMEGFLPHWREEKARLEHWSAQGRLNW